MTILCPMCTLSHAEWVDLVDLETYYRDVGARTTLRIIQCPYCLFRAPIDRLLRKDAKPRIIVQEYEQQALF